MCGSLKYTKLLKNLVQDYVENVGRQVFWENVLKNLMIFFFENQVHKFGVKLVEIFGLTT